jgi:hypothetical protein
MMQEKTDELYKKRREIGLYGGEKLRNDRTLKR